MGIELPKARFSAPPQPKKRQVPVDQILQVMGNNPYAGAIDDFVPALSKALDDRAKRRRQQNAVKSLADAAGETIPEDSDLSPDEFMGIQTVKSNRSAKKAQAAKDRVGLELQMEGLRKGYSEVDPVTRAVRKYPGVQGLEIRYDPEENPYIFRGEDYAPATAPKSGGGSGSGKAGRSQQVGVTAEGYPVSFSPDKKINEVARPDGRGGYSIEPHFGQIFPKTTGSEEQRRMGLAQIGRDSFNDVKTTLQRNPGALTEAKGIRYSPGQVYGQFASQEAKQLFTNISNILQAETYATTGAAMSIPELEQKALMFMVKMNDSPQDVLSRLEITTRNLQSLSPRSLPTIPTAGGETRKATHRWNPATNRIEEIR